MERQHWRGGLRIYLLLPESGTPEKDLLLRRGLQMNEDQLRRHYLGKLYGGEIPAFPGTAASGAAPPGGGACPERARGHRQLGRRRDGEGHSHRRASAGRGRVSPGRVALE